LWSRSQKNAVYFLNLYLHSGDPSQFAQYQASLAVPIGDEFARWALERDPVDVEAARIGFLQGGNHPDDVPGLIWLFRYFKQVSFLKEAIREWAATGPMLLELSVFGEVIRSELKSGPVQDSKRLQLLSSRLSELNTQFTVHAKRFSTVLGEGSRAIKMTLTGVNIVTAMTLILLLIWHTRRLVLQRQAFEDALHAEKERLAWQASHDWLTGLSNRRAFEARLQSELDDTAAGSLGLILLDLDQFKDVNDSCGHLAGDRLLCQISRLLQQERRPHDLVARLGGDEFGLTPSAMHALRRRGYRRTDAPVARAIRLRLGRSLLCSDRQHRRCLHHGRQHHARGRDAARGCRLLSRQGERTQPCSGR
jgi:GGDEF domain-containing protein